MSGLWGRRGAPVRGTRWLLTAAVSLGLAAGAGAAPAYAADSLSVIAPTQVVLPLGPSGAGNPVRTVEVDLNRSNLQVPAEGKLTIDTSELSGVADITWPAACTPAPGGGGAECDAPHSPGSGSDTVVLELTAAAGAHSGATGTIHYTGHAPDTADAHAQTQVSVRSGADVELHGVPSRLSMKPGATAALPFALTNQGGEPGEGTALTAIPSHALDSVPRFGNCWYEVDGAGKVSWMTCVLPPVTPGGTVSYGGLTFTAGANALIEDVEFGASAYTSDYLADVHKHHALVRGTGPDLVPDGSPVLANGTPYMSDVKVDVDNTADLALSVPPLTGTKGAKVDAVVSVASLGPADYDDAWNENPVGQVDFRPPPGTTVVRANEDCAVFDAHGKRLQGDAPGARYSCPLGFIFMSGRQQDIHFTLRIDKVVADAAGSAAVKPAGTFDKNPANNSAKVVLNAASGGGTPTGGSSSSGGGGHASSGGTSGSGSGSASGGTVSGGSTPGTAGTGGTTATGGTSGSTDGNLAATGTDPVGLIGGVAMGSGLLGGAVLLLLRSRRQRTARWRS